MRNQKIISEFKNLEDNQTDEINNTNHNFSSKNIIFFFISEYGWFIIILLIVGLGFLFPYYHPAQIFYSKNATWNSDYTPKIFMHISDIHISSFYNEKTNGSLKFFSDFLDYNPDLILNSGDIVDNYENGLYWIQVGSQWKDDWDLYDNFLRKNLSKFKVIDVAGNHDVFAIDSLLSTHNNFLDYSFTFNRSNVKTIDDFVIKKIKLFNETFILYNEYIFPIPHPPFGVFPHPTKHMLDLLENAIDTSEDCYILTHYQVDRNWFVKSSKGNTYENIISKKNIKAIFTGHDHPYKTMIIHHGQGAVEFCSATPFKRKTQGLITLDNEQMVYNPVTIKKKGEKPLFFMSYPVPKEQISSHHVFNYKQSEIRIISYARKQVKLKISGDIQGEMVFKKKLSNGADLYTYPINLEFGSYSINVMGDGCNIKREFILGNEFKGKKELSICFVRALLIIRLCLIPLFIGIYIIIIPWGGNIKIAKDLENIIEGKDYDKFKKLSYFYKFFFIIKIIILGPFIIRERYKLNNLSTKLVLFFSSLYPFILPMHFHKPIYGVHGFSYLFFIIIGKRIQFDEWVLQFFYGYYLSIIFINAIYLGGTKYHKKKKIIYFINLILIFLFWSGGIFLNFRFIGESIWWPCLFLTPIYVIVPIILKIKIHFFTTIDLTTESSLISKLEDKEENENEIN